MKSTFKRPGRDLSELDDKFINTKTVSFHSDDKEKSLV